MAAKESGQTPPHRDSYYLLIYNLFGLISIATQVIRSLALTQGSISAGRTLQNRLLRHVVRLPMSFFDSQPTGRLLNRFTKDVESVDMNVAQAVDSFLTCFVSVVGALMVVIVVTPGVVALIIPIGFLYYQVQQLFIATSRETKRLDSLAFSPIFGNFNETLQGLITIRAFRKQADFDQKDRRLIDHSNRAYWPIVSVNRCGGWRHALDTLGGTTCMAGPEPLFPLVCLNCRWLSVRIETYGNLVVYGAAIFVGVLTQRNAGLAGLALTSALNVTGFMNWMVRQASMRAGLAAAAATSSLPPWTAGLACD